MENGPTFLLYRTSELIAESCCCGLNVVRCSTVVLVVKLTFALKRLVDENSCEWYQVTAVLLAPPGCARWFAAIPPVMKRSSQRYLNWPLTREKPGSDSVPRALLRQSYHASASM